MDGVQFVAHHPGDLAEPQDLHKRALEGIKIAAAEIADAALVRLLVGRQHPEGHVLVAGVLDPAGGEDPHAVRIEQQQRQPQRGRLRLHPRVKALLPARILGLGRDQDL